MAKQPQIVTPGQVAGKYAAEDLAHAGDSAREMIGQSKVLQTCIATMIASRRLYMVARSAMDNEVIKGWEVDDAELILQTLVMSAQEKANEKFEIADLHKSCMGTVLPFIDIVLQQSRDTGEDVCPDQPDETNEATEDDRSRSEAANAPTSDVATTE